MINNRKLLLLINVCQYLYCFHRSFNFSESCVKSRVSLNLVVPSDIP